jgi:choline dehydrogenase-like flavoprotein
MKQADLIIVGAGSAGCLLASRLVREHRLRVMLIEPPAAPAAAIDRERPARWLHLRGSSEDWDFQTEPVAALAGRRLRWPRGRGPGGSSRINAMIWFPPTDQDLRMLVQASGDLWTWSQLRAAYTAVCESVQPQPPLWLSEASQRFLRAAADCFPQASPMVYRRVNRQARRWNPASLLDGEDRVRILRATVDRVIWDGDRAVGVRVIEGASSDPCRAGLGVVLCGGAIATPAILMRSGLGPRDELARLRIDSRADLFGIGENLQDHLIMPVIFRTRSNEPFPATPTVADLARWQTLGRGPIGSNLAECGGLFDQDTLQIHVTPTHYLSYPQAALPAITLGVNVTQPLSRGRLTVADRDPGRPPRIDAGYLSHPADLDGLVRGVHLARSIAASPSLSQWLFSEELPGDKRHSGAAIGKAIGRYAQTLYHPVGTCRLGREGDAPVDARFAVRGSERLWVVDAAVLPRLTIGNPNASVMMLAWLAGQFIGEASLSN